MPHKIAEEDDQDTLAEGGEESENQFQLPQDTELQELNDNLKEE